MGARITLSHWDMVTVPGCFLGCGTASMAWEGQLPGAASWGRALEAAPYPCAALGSSMLLTMSISHRVITARRSKKGCSKDGKSCLLEGGGGFHWLIP